MWITINGLQPGRNIFQVAVGHQWRNLEVVKVVGVGEYVVEWGKIQTRLEDIVTRNI
jgi:hypothetical protein